MDVNGLAQQPRFWGTLNLVGLKFWLTGIAFLVVYIFLNLLTERLDVDRLAITPWSPDNGLSLVLLIERLSFAPFIFVGAVLVDVFIAETGRNLYVTAGSELILTAAYVVFAWIVRKIVVLHLSRFTLSYAIKLFIAIGIGTIFSSSVYVAVLYACAAIPSRIFRFALLRFLLGDILGIITIIFATVLTYVAFCLYNLILIVYREEIIKKTDRDVVRKCLLASQIILSPKALLTIYSLERSNRLHNPDNRRDIMHFLTHRYYLSRNFNLRQRVRAAMDHKLHEIHCYDCEYARLIYDSDGILLWQCTVENMNFTIVLVSTDDNRHEGDLSVILKVNDRRLCRMSFCYLDANIFGLQSGMTMLISRNQTDRTLARLWFDRCFKQNTPQFFCLAAICGIAASNEFSAMLAIKHDSQIAYEDTYESGFRNSYTALWEKFDAVEIERHVYMLEVPLKLRLLQTLDSSHRARARNRRKYWDDIFQSAGSCMVKYRNASKS